MKKRLSNLRDRVPLLGDALIGSIGRFQDPVAFVFTLLDYLVVGLGGYGCVTAELNDATGATEPWTVSTFPPDYSSPPALEPIAIGGVGFTILPHEGLATDEPRALLGELRRWILQNDPGFSDAMTRQFRAAREEWAEAPLPYSAFSWSDDKVPEATRAVAQTLGGALKKLIGEGNSQGASQLHLALAFAPESKRISVWAAAEDGGPTDHVELREAVSRACATGFAQWSAAGASRWLAVPCVVGRFPWAVIYTEVRAPSWIHGYRLYRDVLPRLLEDIRTQARHAYLTALIATTDDAFSRENPSVGELKRRWAVLSQSFPFSVPQLPDVVVTESEDPLLFATQLQAAAESLQPVTNSYFPSSVGSVRPQSWGDIADLEAVLRSAIGSRLGIAGMAKASLAQAISHEFKNLTANVAVVAGDLGRKARRLAGETEIAELAKVLGIQALQLNGVSLALYSLATPGAELCFEPSKDAVDLLRAAVRVALEFRAMTETTFVVQDPLTFQESVDILGATYGASTRRARQHRSVDALDALAAFVNVTPVAFLLAAAGEPVRNVRVREPLKEGDQPIHAWTAIDHGGPSVLLRQRTIEAPQTPRSPIPSPGAMRANRLLPATFCRIDPLVRPMEGVPNFVPTDCGGVIVDRETRIHVFGRPIPQES